MNERSLELSENKYTLIMRVVTGVLVAASFIYANAFTSLGFAYSLPYQDYAVYDISAWLVVFIAGALSYLIYFFISNFFYRLIHGFRAGMFISTDALFTKNTYMINLDVAYIIGNTVLGSISIAYFYSMEVYYVCRLFVGKLAVLFTLALFYLLIARKVSKTERRPVLAAVLLAAAILFILS